MPKGRGRRDSESDAGTEEQTTVGTFETLRDEGEHFVHVKQYQRAIESFTKALEMRPGDKTCLVARAKCFLNLGNSAAALEDSEAALENEEEGKGKDIRALCTKAEALYQKGDFENALVFYHRGHKLRPELQEFRLGIQKSQEAINNSIGTPDSVKLEASGDLSFFYKQEEKQKQQQRGYSKPSQVQKREEKKERSKPQDGGSSKTTKQLLGALYNDQAFLEKLYDSLVGIDNPDDTDRYIKDRAIDGLDYLNLRADFWRQQKPMYARERDRRRQRQQQSAGSLKTDEQDRMKYILQRLEEIDEAQANGKYEDSLKKSQKTLNKIEQWGEDSIKNKPALEANLYGCMGNAYLELGKYREALEYHDKDLAIGQEHDIEEAESRALDNLGRTKARMGKYEDAITIWQKKLPKSKSPLESTWLFHEIGRCHLELGQNSDAKDFGEKSLAAAQEADDRGWQLHATVLIAQAEVKCNELQAAADSFERAKEIAEELKDSSAQTAIKKALEEVNSRIVQGVQDEDKDKAEGQDQEDGQKSGGSTERESDDETHGKKKGHKHDKKKDKQDKEEHKKHKKGDKEKGKKGKAGSDDNKSDDEDYNGKGNRKGVKREDREDRRKDSDRDEGKGSKRKGSSDKDMKEKPASDTEPEQAASKRDTEPERAASKTEAPASDHEADTTPEKQEEPTPSKEGESEPKSVEGAPPKADADEKTNDSEADGEKEEDTQQEKS